MKRTMIIILFIAVAAFSRAGEAAEPAGNIIALRGKAAIERNAAVLRKTFKLRQLI